MTDAASLAPLPLPHRFARWVTLVSFGLMTVGFALYHLLLRLGLIEAFLGGYLGIVGVVLFFPLMVVYIMQVAAEPWRFNRGDVLYFSFMLVLTLVASFNLARGRVIDIAQGHLAAVAEITVIYVIFNIADLRWRPFQIAMWVAFAVLAMIMVSLSLGGMGAEEYQEVQLLPTADVANYAFYAVTFLYLLVCCTALARNMPLRLVVYAIGIVALFYNGARSELIVAIPMFVIAESLLSRKNMALVLVACFVFLFLMGPLIDYLEQAFPNNRAVELLSDFSTDQSVREREFVYLQGLDVIRHHPVFGSYGYYVEGYYVHNLLSAWAELGIFGFALFLAGVLYPVAGATQNFIKNRIDPELLAFALFAGSSFALFVFAKNFSHPTFGVTLAFYSRQLTRKHLTERFTANSLMSRPQSQASVSVTT